ncbi:hypothetical protein Q5M85_02480 [Paraclostridium bifermentans]|nr:hypothetical protein [Paraclostridium bifermentans]
MFQDLFLTETAQLADVVYQEHHLQKKMELSQTQKEEFKELERQ